MSPFIRLNELVASTVPVAISLSEDTQKPAADITHDTGHEAKVCMRACMCVCACTCVCVCVKEREKYE